MKIVTIVLKQGSPDHPDTYVVSRLENTVQLTLGQRVPRSLVSEWCAMNRVKVAISGMEETEAEAELAGDMQSTITDKVERIDALALVRGQQ